jgi:hypothetical protein
VTKGGTGVHIPDARRAFLPHPRGQGRSERPATDGLPGTDLELEPGMLVRRRARAAPGPEGLLK